MMTKKDKRHIDICFSPQQVPLYERKDNITIVIDLFRATSVIVNAIYNGAKTIIPVSEINELLEYKEKGFLISGERNAERLDNVDFGNSPLEFNTPIIKNKKIAISTTNGTKAFKAVKNSKCVVASLLNYSAIVEYISNIKNDVLIVCSGWKMKMNIEDTLLASKFAETFLENNNFYSESDSIAIAKSMLKNAGNNWEEYILKSSPRLMSKYELLKNDIKFALQKDVCNVVPRYKNGEISIYD